MVESARYDVLASDGRFEVRRYPLTILATVMGMSDNDAFSILFSYISGGNSRREKVPMTAPVLSRDAGQTKIPMTVPVVSDSRSFSFLLPSSYTPSTVPEPDDPRVRIDVHPGRRLAVLRFRGRTGDKNVERRYQELFTIVRGTGQEPKGDPFLMRYNPPITPGFLRRNEVAVELVDGAPS